MTLTGKTRILALAATAALTLGVVGAGAALAQTGGEKPPADSTQKVDGRHHRPARVLKGIFQSIVQASGLDRETFKQGFQNGKSINQVLEENGVDSQTVEDAVLADIKTKLDGLVAGGTLSQEEADRIYAKAPTVVERIMNATPDPARRDKRR